MAPPRSITVVHAGLSGAFDKTFPRIPSGGARNHQGVPCRPRPGLCLGEGRGGGGQGGFLVRSLVDGAGSYSVAHKGGAPSY